MRAILISVFGLMLCASGVAACEAPYAETSLNQPTMPLPNCAFEHAGDGDGIGPGVLVSGGEAIDRDDGKFSQLITFEHNACHREELLIVGDCKSFTAIAIWGAWPPPNQPIIAGMIDTKVEYAVGQRGKLEIPYSASLSQIAKLAGRRGLDVETDVRRLQKEWSEEDRFRVSCGCSLHYSELLTENQ